jgi:hypothetical protein
MYLTKVSYTLSHYSLLLAAVLCCSLPTDSLAQTSPATRSVLEQAMEDELKRSMEELAYEDYEKPFFISYKLNDTRRTTISASLGALVESSDIPIRTKSVRVLIGDYAFNDESLDIPSATPESPYYDISMPIEDDYYGIRRSLWISTDNVYKSATKLYRESQQYVKQQSLPLEKLPHRIFAKAPVVQLDIPARANSLDKEALELLVRELSARFTKEKEIENSIVNLSSWSNTTYFMNSEGTRVKSPSSGVTLFMVAEMKTREGESLYEQAVHHALSPSELPDKATLTKAVDEMLLRLKEQQQAKVFEDSYSGPVLFMGEAVGSVFAATLFGQESLIASNDISTRNGNRYGRTSLDDKIGTKLMATELSIKSVPKLQSFQGVPLLGSYAVDGEGVVPADELTLVENGFLKTLLNSRTGTSESHIPNGHSSDYQMVTPGVIQVSASNTTTLEVLKHKLIAQAKAEGLPFALLVRNVSMGNYGGINVYKVSLEDGSEELLRLGRINQLSMKSLKSVMGVSNTSIAYNAPSRGMASFIVPDGLLLEDIEVLGNKRPYLDDQVLVENPLKSSGQLVED